MTDKTVKLSSEFQIEHLIQCLGLISCHTYNNNTSLPDILSDFDSMREIAITALEWHKALREPKQTANANHYCIQCTDKTTGTVGSFAYHTDEPFVAVSPVFSDLGLLYGWFSENGLKTTGKSFDLIPVNSIDVSV